MTAVSVDPRPATAARSGRTRLRRREALWGYAFTAPALVAFGIFTAVPLVLVGQMSLLDYNALTRESEFIGTGNYERLAQDPGFHAAFVNTFVFALGVVPANLVLGMLLAVLVNQKLPAIGIFRAAYIMPVVMSLVAWSLVWRLLLQDRGGINEWLGLIGIEGPNWLAEEGWALASVIGVQVLKGVGVSMILFLAALQEVPEEIQEAARIDGAGPIRAFFAVSLPLISPTVFLVAVLAMINSLKAFALIQSLTLGGPGYSTTTLGYYVYNTGFNSLQFGPGAAASVVLLVVALILTLIQWWGRKKWVFNED